jgi:glutamate-1-semialdehyde 2,1-aminomutase
MITVAIVQARMDSKRFPNKALQLVCGVPLIGLLLERLARARSIDKIVLATSTSTSNQPLVAYASRAGVDVYEGSEEDVLDRYYQAALRSDADIVVRITGDCPLVDPGLVDATVQLLIDSGADYVSNTDPLSYPDGLDIEAFRFAALERAWGEAADPHQREHVTPFIIDEQHFRKAALQYQEDHSRERWTVDEPADLDVIRNVFEYFGPRRDFSWLEVLQLCEARPELFAANRHIDRDEGSAIGVGQKLWKRARRVIPGGNMLLSKRPEVFLPNQWPAYFSNAKGCHVRDLDGREYIDMSVMSVGTNVLGYCHPEVDGAVHRTVDGGNMTTLNCPEEVYLAERLVDMHPWADMVRLARTGGEANAIAIRIARAASGRDRVAICGYHGWHDWYLAANLRDESLADHLLPGLEPRGVPGDLRDSVLPFHYNAIDQLESLVQQYPDIGVIMMEVARGEPPRDEFLQRVRRIASERGIILIFDECTSGFRETFGGIHKKYGVEPDMAVFGKALGNGYAITATIGRREIMEAAQTTFISSTFWTERVGPAAALATLDVMERMRSWEVISETGRGIKRGWHDLAKRNSLTITVSGLDAVPEFSFDSPRALAYRTLLTQEMLARGFLAATLLYVCIDHNAEVVARYFDALDSAFGMVAECEAGRDVHDLLRGPVCHSGFKRLT